MRLPRAVGARSQALAGTPARSLVERLPRRPGRDAGSVTVELAVGLIAVVMVLALVLAVVAAGVAQLRCTDAARAGARAALAGESAVVVRQVAERVAGGSAQVGLVVSDGWVDVTVSRPVVGASGWGPLTAHATVSAPVEP